MNGYYCFDGVSEGQVMDRAAAFVEMLTLLADEMPYLRVSCHGPTFIEPLNYRIEVVLSGIRTPGQVGKFVPLYCLAKRLGCINQDAVYFLSN